ncbi:MAG: sporulation protein [Oscillospiraceae bacterium]|nr:sporulation protein [Oscillospiraceae bacterium]
MEKRMPRRASLPERMAAVFDLPGDVVAGLPRIELMGDNELRMENHRGILDYGSEEIHISGGKLAVRVTGEDLELRAMNQTELLITGHIRAVELE